MAYVKEDPIEVSAKFLISSASNDMEVRATAPDGLTIPPTKLKRESGIWVLPDTKFIKPNPPANPDPLKKIRFFNGDNSNDAFRIIWEFRHILDTGPSAWEVIGRTNHTMYFTESASVNPFDLSQETLYNIGCRNAAGVDEPAGSAARRIAIVNAIWSEFADESVARVIPSKGSLRTESMKYWGSYNNGISISTGSQLLNTGDACCDAWARLMGMVVNIQGLSGDYIKINPPSGHSTFTAHNLREGTPFTVLNTGDYKWINPSPTGDEANLFLVDGLTGQGGITPSYKTYNHHAVFGYEDKFYDTSYGGVSYNFNQLGFIAHEDSHFGYFGKDVTVQIEGQAQKIHLSKTNPAGYDCSYNKLTNSLQEFK